MHPESSMDTHHEHAQHTRAEAGKLIRRNVERIRKLEEWSQRHRSLPDKMASKVATFCGRITFVWIHAVIFALWILWNTLPHFFHFDPYPFTFLTLCVSLEAIFLSSFILIAQNYEMRLSERRAHLDLQINLLAEQEGTKALTLLHAMARKMGVIESDDPEIAQLVLAVRPETIHQEIEAAFGERQERAKNKH
jgi:uncharacterized membrane protein